MSLDGWAAIVFIILLGLFLWKKRSKVEIKKLLFPIFYIIMYRSNVGLYTMDLWARKLRRFFIILGYIGIAMGFVGMVLYSNVICDT